MKRLVPLALLACAVLRAAEAQGNRRALEAGTERYLVADYQAAVRLLSQGLDPAGAPQDSLWFTGVARLADALLVLRRDSLATTWLRWATRLAPRFVVNEEEMPPAVVRAARAARAFVDSTPSDRFVATTTFTWPGKAADATGGAIRLQASAVVPITARIGEDQFMRGGESRQLPPGSYAVVVSAPGSLPTRLTVEVLPGITTAVRVSLLPETAGRLYVAARPWATVYVDSQPIGYTRVAGHRLAPGRHVLRLLRGEGPVLDVLDTTFVVPERGLVRVSWGPRETSGDATLDSALSALDAGGMERGTGLLEQWLAVSKTASGHQGWALARLAEAMWSLGEKDSANAYLRQLVQTNPFFLPASDLLNPDLQAAYWNVRRGTPMVALRAPRDTTIFPFSDALPVEVAVGEPGRFRLVLRLTTPRLLDSVVAATLVDSVTVVRLRLVGRDGAVLAPGVYALEGEVQLAGSAQRDLLKLTLEPVPVDTTPHEPPIPSVSYRRETRKAAPSFYTVLEGLGMGALAVALPMMINNGDLSGRAVPFSSVLIGASVAGFEIGLSPSIKPIPENVAFNQDAQARWQERNRDIAARNAAALRSAPFRVRVERQP